MDNYTRARLRDLKEQRDAAIQWARKYRHQYPDGARNNVAVARSVNQEIVRIKRARGAYDDDMPDPGPLRTKTAQLVRERFPHLYREQ